MISVSCGIIHVIVDIQVKSVLHLIFFFLLIYKGKNKKTHWLKKLSLVNEK